MVIFHCNQDSMYEKIDLKLLISKFILLLWLRMRIPEFCGFLIHIF